MKSAQSSSSPSASSDADAAVRGVGGSGRCDISASTTLERAWLDMHSAALLFRLRLAGVLLLDDEAVANVLEDGRISWAASAMISDSRR